jgi:predicted nucleic acid-binding protein
VILYCDTSALAKCYFREVHSDTMLELRRRAEATAVCVIGHAEFHSALHRKRREGALTEIECDKLLGGFEEDWGSFVQVEVSPELNRMAAGLLRRHALRAFDALHLASALLLRERAPHVEVGFAGFDDRQRQAAEAEGLEVLPLLPQRGPLAPT